MFLRDTNPGRDGRLMGHEIGLQEVTEYTGSCGSRVRSAGKGKKRDQITPSEMYIRLKYMGVCVCVDIIGIYI